MRRHILFYLLCIWAQLAWAQEQPLVRVPYPGGPCTMYRLYLKDKDPVHSPFSTARPEAYLSVRSIERRKRQGLKVDESDLPVALAYIDSVRRVAGIDVVGRSKWNNTLLVRVRKEAQVERLGRLPFVKGMVRVFASPDSVTTRQRTRYSAHFRKYEVSRHRYGASAEQIKMLGGDRLHAKGYKGEGMMIAVLDAGFMNADSIAALGTIRVAEVHDFVVPASTNVYTEMGHGTKVLSTMGVNTPYYYIGTAPAAQYLLLRCEDERTESLAEEDYWAEAAEYADSMGVDVINSSLGYHAFDDTTTSHRASDLDGRTALISHTASMLASKGIVCVCAAGNDGDSEWQKVNVPADATGVLTVGSVDDKGRRASFSSVGPTADGRIKPDVMAQGKPAMVVLPSGVIDEDYGTSFSAPQVAGMVACLWQALPHLTAQQVIDAVRQSGSNRLHPDYQCGYGVPNFWEAYRGMKREESKVKNRK